MKKFIPLVLTQLWILPGSLTLWLVVADRTKDPEIAHSFPYEHAIEQWGSYTLWSFLVGQLALVIWFKARGNSDESGTSVPAE